MDPTCQLDEKSDLEPRVDVVLQDDTASTMAGAQGPAEALPRSQNSQW
jgi:hypothetical protein